MPRMARNAVFKPAPPVGYDDNLIARCFPQKWRRLGSPVEYLDSIGIVPIVEFIIKGHLRHDVAEVTNVPFLVLQDWLTHNGYDTVVNDAEVFSAEGMLAEGMKHLRDAHCDFDLKKANSIIKHAQYMAEKKNRPVYGQAANAKPSSPITYVFNVGQTHAEPLARAVIEASVVPQGQNTEEGAGNKQTLDLAALFGVSPTALKKEEEKNKKGIMTKVLAHLTEASAEEVVLVADRPVEPTAQQPDIGPFFEGPTL